MTLGLVTPIMYSKVTGKTIGVPGSISHTMTNDNLTKQAKAKTVLEGNKEACKDILSLVGTAASVGAATSLVTGCSNKAQTAFGSVKKSVANFCDKILLKGAGTMGQNISLKDAIKEMPVFKKFNSLPTPAKAGIIAGMAVLSVLTPLYSNIISAKAGYIEGKNETK